MLDAARDHLETGANVVVTVEANVLEPLPVVGNVSRSTALEGSLGGTV